MRTQSILLKSGILLFGTVFILGMGVFTPSLKSKQSSAEVHQSTQLDNPVSPDIQQTNDQSNIEQSIAPTPVSIKDSDQNIQTSSSNSTNLSIATPIQQIIEDLPPEPITLLNRHTENRPGTNGNDVDIVCISNFSDGSIVETKVGGINYGAQATLEWHNAVCN